MEGDKIRAALSAFNEECNDFLHFNSEVPIIEYNSEDPEWQLMFYREYVSKNQPVVIKNAYNKMPALSKWNINYLLKKLSQKHVIVAVTPNGYADGILEVDGSELNLNHNADIFGDGEELFVLPEDVKMTFEEFIENISEPKPNYVCYIQRQDSNLTDDFPELWKDVHNISWTQSVFGKKPDAINFWMGDSRAITSMHKDFYENIYCVIDGFKDFILIPPTNLPHLTYKKYKIAKYKNVSTSGYEIDLQNDDNGDAVSVSWLANDPLKNKVDDEKFADANLYRVHIEKGDCLYLPSLWFHHVQQSQGCIALNYWYDMEFDVKFCYYKLLENLC